ncbi:putative arabinan endo-1,5-alpha-L-arabinosidase C [Aspergillus sclerotioniger CBS 115572]|uniref:Arabinan endo-1,5-alpha-L-arabinosidase n=1 Tax=Aspergillus sclerotioniger CBS 115572 TaxID=1450535 RepID=A0A317W1W1_9EURO|nr:putative arabinan endo-1,5-alpha-L-arabinosidase C [Aspergillus sclerotioniger CBS 115572]PWY80463.1 putative arabinan endo-1,5-alpha-L-arabinosidase C [Aspergillus sclerotioniger CBS 115572]
MFSFVLLLCVALANAYSDPGACSGSCWAHDPNVIQRKSDGTFFRFSTGLGIHISSASSITGPWTDLGVALADGSEVTVGNASNLWAPDVHYVDGTYYMYYASSTLGSQSSTIGVASSTTLEVGSWTDHGEIGVTSSSSTPYNAIDPNWITIGSTPYLQFGSYWDGIYQVEMTDSLTSSGSTPTNLAYNASGNHAIEAAFMFERGGYYYLTFSSGQAQNYISSPPAQGDEYRIVVCRSQTGTGDFVDQNGVACTNSGGTTVLASHDYVFGPGGQGVLNDTTYGLVVYYHYANKNIGLTVDDYQFGWNQLTWNDGWPVVA